MPQAKFFNKGTLRGLVSKSELVEFDGKNGKNKFLTIEVNTDGGTNKIKAVIFSSKSNPSKAQEFHEQYPVGSQVEVAGKIGERAYESNGRKGVDRSLAAHSVREMREDAKQGATFIFQGIVEKIKEVDGGANVTVRYEETYTPEGKEAITKQESITLFADESGVETMEDNDVVKGCNVKFKGKIFNMLEFDEYGDIVDNVQMFKIDKFEDIIQKDDITEPEQLDFL